MKFKSDIEIQARVEAGGSTGDPGQILSSTGSGVAWIDQNAIGAATDFVFFNVKNETGSTILKGKGVMAVGTDGNSGHILIDEMVADGTVESKYFLGVLEEDIANGGFARVISFGRLDQFNTNGQNGETWADGQVLWCDPANPGDFTITEPDGPNVKIAAAFILNKATNGKIQVRVQANEGIHDLHDTKITSQVDGDVLVWDNTTGVWFNDSTLNVDYTNGRVGIGTTNPGQDLEISGQGNVAIRLTSTDSTTSTLQFADSDDVNVGMIQYHHGGNYMSFRTNDDERMRITSAGNVGIGTLSPGEKLEVAGNIKTTGDITIDNSSGDPFLKFKTSAQEYVVRIDQSDSEKFQIRDTTNNETRVTVTTSGNVGIGTSNPTEALMVEGWIRVANNTGIKFNTSASSGDPTLNIDSSAHWNFLNTAGNNLLKIDNGGNVGIGTTSPSEKLEVAGKGLFTGTEVKVQNASDPSIQVSDTDANYKGAMRWLSSDNVLEFYTRYAGTYYTSNLVLDRGNVGIGTDSPSQKLHIVGDSVESKIQLSVTGNTGNTQIHFGDDDDVNSGRVAYNHSEDSMSLYTNNSEKFRINSSGNVGIGTASPSNKLHVKSDGNEGIFMEGTGNGHWFNFKSGLSNLWSMGAQTGLMGWYNRTDSTYKMVITDTGNVGIGTTSPTDYGATANTLEVRGASGTGTGLIRLSNADNTVGTSLYSSSSSGTLNVQTNHPLTFATNNNEKMRITSGGTLLLGDTNVPAESVWKGTAVFGQTGTDKVIVGHLESSTDGAIIGGHNAALDGWAPLNIDGTELRFNVEQSRKMTMDSNGNLGIGTTSPSRKLHVVGGSTYAALLDSDQDYTLGLARSGTEEWWLKTYTDGRFAIHENGVGDKVTIKAGGNVGIGTSSPATKLHVAGEIRAYDSSNTYYATMTANSTWGYFNTNATRIYLNKEIRVDSGLIGSYNEALQLRTSGTTRMYINNSTGNVGIGNTNPGEKLSVSGNGRFSNGSAGTLQIKHNYSFGQPNWGIKLDGDTGTSGGYLSQYINLGGFALEQGGAYYGGGPWRTDANSTSYSSVNGINGRIVFYTNSSLTANSTFTPTERMRIDSTGNVGIGTTSPTAKLDVSGTVNASQGYSTNNTSRKYFWRTDNTANSGNIWKKIGTYNSDGQSSRIMITATGTTSYGGGTKPGKMTIIAQVNNNNLLEGSFWQEGMAGQYGDVGFVSNSATSHDIYYQVGSYAEYAYEAIVSDGTFTTDSTTVSTPSFTRQPERSWNVNNNLFVNSSGNVGIGTTSPSQTLDVRGVINLLDDNTFISQIRSDFSNIISDDLLNGLFTIGDDFITRNIITNTVSFRGGGSSEVMRFSESNVGIGTTNPGARLEVVAEVGGNKIGAQFRPATSGSNYGARTIYVHNTPYGQGAVFHRAGTYDNLACSFQYQGSQKGSITIQPTSTSYNTTSDYRLKENLIPIADSIDRVKQLKPKRFNFIGDNTTVDGFIAHEVQEVVPESVTGEKDAVLPNGEADYQGIDQSKLVPLLTAALQDAITKIEQLETRIQTLENNG